MVPSTPVVSGPGRKSQQHQPEDIPPAMDPKTFFAVKPPKSAVAADVGSASRQRDAVAASDPTAASAAPLSAAASLAAPTTSDGGCPSPSSSDATRALSSSSADAAQASDETSQTDTAPVTPHSVAESIRKQKRSARRRELRLERLSLIEQADDEDEKIWDVSHIPVVTDGSWHTPEYIAVRQAPLIATAEQLDEADLLERVRDICALERYSNTSIDEIRLQDYRLLQHGDRRPIRARSTIERSRLTMNDLSMPSRSLVVFRFQSEQAIRHLFIPRFTLMKAREARLASQDTDLAISWLQKSMRLNPDPDDSDDELDGLRPYSDADTSELDTSTVYRVDVTRYKFATMAAVLAWLQTGDIRFSVALRSSGSAQSDERKSLHWLSPDALKPVSPKSVWRVAHSMQLPALQKLALAAFRDRLDDSNVVAEYFSISTDDELHDVAAQELHSRWERVRCSQQMRQTLAKQKPGLGLADRLVGLFAGMERSAPPSPQSLSALYAL